MLQHQSLHTQPTQIANNIIILFRTCQLIMLQSSIAALVLLCFCGSCYSFKMTMKLSQANLKQSMMKKVSGVACASAIFISSISGMAMPAIAAVGEGDLPPGAMAFQKLLKYQVFLYCCIFYGKLALNRYPLHLPYFSSTAIIKL